MRVMRCFVGVSLLVMWACPASAESMFGYDSPAAKVNIEGRIVTVAPHRRKNQLLMQKAFEAIASYPEAWKIETYRAAAERFVAPVGCGIEKVEAITVMGGTWYASYVCPARVDLYTLIKAQRKALKAGAPLKRETEPLPELQPEKVAE